MNNYMAMNIEELRERCILLEHQNAELTAEVEWFMEQFRLERHRQLGASSERTDSSEQQPSLFNEAEKESSPGQAEPALEAITYNRRKKKGHREAMLKELPIYASDKWLEPLYHRLHELLLESDILQADETELQVLHEAGRKAQSKSFMWLYRTGRDGPPIVLFDYKTSLPAGLKQDLCRLERSQIMMSRITSVYSWHIATINGLWTNGGQRRYENHCHKELREHYIGADAIGKPRKWLTENQCPIHAIDGKPFPDAESGQDVWNRMSAFCKQSCRAMMKTSL